MALPVLADLKNYLRIIHDAENPALVAILASATGLALQYIDRPVAALSRTYIVEDRRSASLAISRLSYDPIPAAFLRIPDAPVDTGQTLTITDRWGTTLDATQYRVEAATGIVRAGAANSYPTSSGFAAFPYTIVATTGLATRSDYSTAVEPALNQGILDIAADLYQRRNPAATDENDGAGGSVRYGRSEETLPTRAITFLMPFVRPAV